MDKRQKTTPRAGVNRLGMHKMGPFRLAALRCAGRDPRQLADQASGNYLTGAIFPAITHEDPRYYTLYHGGFLRRTEYAMSRVLVTRNDQGRNTFNYSEVLGNAAATAAGGFYYPEEERTGAGEACERLAMQILTDAVGNVFEEFWPDINKKFFHER